MTPVAVELLLGYHPCSTGFSKLPLSGTGTMSGGELISGCPKGYRRRSKGSLRMVGNHLKSAKAEGSLAATPTGEQVMKAGT